MKEAKGSLTRWPNQRGVLFWRFQYRENGIPHTNSLGKCREVSRAEAAAKGRAIMEALGPTQRRRRKALTVEDYVNEEYLVSRSALWKRSTEYTTTDLIERYIFRPIGSRLLPTISRRDLEALLLDLANDGLSFSIVSHVRWQLKAIFEMAAGDGQIKANPAATLKPPPNAKAPVPQEIGDEALIRQAIMQLPTSDRLFLVLTANAGMRPGEVAALQIGDIQDGVIQVRRRIYRGGIDTPKSAKGKRPIPVHNYKFLIAEQISHLLDQSPEGWLFPSENGRTPVNYPALYRKRLKPVLEAVGLTRFNFQAARATFANALKAEIRDPKVRADIMGHTVDVHEEVYQRTTADQRNRAMKRVHKRLAGPETRQ